MAGFLSFVMYPLPYFFALMVVVLFHEFGHFFVMRLFGVRIAKFSVGAWKTVFSWKGKKSGTLYRLGAVPFVGYVLPSDKGDPESVSVSGVYFSDMSVWKRFLCILAGPVASFLLCVAILSGNYYVSGDADGPAKIIGVVPGGAGDRGGLKVGDEIVYIGARHIYGARDFKEAVVTGGVSPVVFRVNRPNLGPVDLVLHPVSQHNASMGNLITPMVGIAAGPVVPRSYGVFGAVGHGFYMTYDFACLSASMFREVLTGNLPLRVSEGPVGTAREFHGAVEDGKFGLLFRLIALFSMSLGLVNLVPLLPLDGGRLFFLVLEASARRPVSPVVEDYMTRVGLAVVCLSFCVSVAIDLVGAG